MFSGGFTVEDAASVLGVRSDDADDAPGRDLFDKSLVTARPEGGASRYRLLDTTRAYGQEKLFGKRRG